MATTWKWITSCNKNKTTLLALLLSLSWFFLFYPVWLFRPFCPNVTRACDATSPDLCISNFVVIDSKGRICEVTHCLRWCCLTDKIKQWKCKCCWRSLLFTQNLVIKLSIKQLWLKLQVQVHVYSVSCSLRISDCLSSQKYEKQYGVKSEWESFFPGFTHLPPPVASTGVNKTKLGKCCLECAEEGCVNTFLLFSFFFYPTWVMHM